MHIKLAQKITAALEAMAGGGSLKAACVLHLR